MNILGRTVFLAKDDSTAPTQIRLRYFQIIVGFSMRVEIQKADKLALL